MDRDEWWQLRKLVSFEFSTRVLRNYSFAVFRGNATKLVRVVHNLSDDGLAFDMQVSTLKDLRNIPNIQNSLSSGTQKLIFFLLIL